MPDVTVDDLGRRLDRVLVTLLNEVVGSRSTLRLDDARYGWNVDLVCAEALLPTVKSLRGSGTIDQRAAETVRWLAQHKRNLIQPDLTNNPKPAPPPALVATYAAKAQMLGPLLDARGALVGWISVHYVDGPHSFNSKDVRALERAKHGVAKLIGLDSFAA